MLIAKVIFVPPVIIGSIQKNGGRKDIILDGQQRLTTILFAHIGRYLDIKKYCDMHKTTDISIFDGVNGDDDNDEPVQLVELLSFIVCISPLICSSTSYMYSLNRLGRSRGARLKWNKIESKHAWLKNDPIDKKTS